MQIDFFNYKVIELWDKYKKEGNNSEIAAYLISSLFIHEHSCLAEIIAKEIENQLGQIFLGLELTDYSSRIESATKDHLIATLLPYWKKLKSLKPVYEEFEWLKDEENVKKFIEKLEFLRNCEQITLTEPQ